MKQRIFSVVGVGAVIVLAMCAGGFAGSIPVAHATCYSCDTCGDASCGRVGTTGVYRQCKAILSGSYAVPGAGQNRSQTNCGGIAEGTSATNCVVLNPLVACGSKALSGTSCS